MSERNWYALKVRYVKSDRISAQFTQLYSDVERQFIPPVTGLLFVFTTRESVEDFMHHRDDGRFVSFIWDKSARNPVVVKEKAMDDFIRICSLFECPIVMTERPHITAGSRVRVKEGPLKGLEGRVVRMKKSRRILVNVDDVLWAATEFVAPELLEIIGD